MRRALGKGLTQLLSEPQSAEAPVREIPIDAIVANPRQPRTHFSSEALAELAESIRNHGILQPLVVRPLGSGKYELIAGERRFRAARLAGLKVVPVSIRTADARGSLELALIENLQREDIGPLESARAFRRLIDEFDLTQEQVAERVGKSRTAVANTVRLLRLPQRVLEALEKGTVSEGHVRPLLALSEPVEQLALFEKIVQQGLTSKQVEKLAGARVKTAPGKRRTKPGVVDATDPNWRALEARASEVLGAPVELDGSEHGGKIAIRFFSEEDLLRIMEKLGVEL